MSIGDTLHYKENKDYESNLGKIRVDAGISISQLCTEAQIHQGVFSALQNGTVSPLFLVGLRAGQVKPYVERMLLVLNCTLADAFPRYTCGMSKTEELSEGQKMDITISDASLAAANTDCLFWRDDLKAAVTRILTTVTPREEAVLRMRFFDGMTLDEVGVAFGTSRERIRQIEAKALRQLRRPERDGFRKIKEYWDE